MSARESIRVENAGLCTPDKGERETWWPATLPGLVIFVHGVNSMGEWYDAAEQGLCAGLNERLGRNQFARQGREAGVLEPNAYLSELTEEGELNDEVSAKSFIATPGHSPVIRFRWGYRAHPEELAEYEPNVWLNRDDAWGGGPFANGTSCLADLWGGGLNDRLFLGVTAQHVNPTNRPVYRCPPRHYMAHAAERLARLVARIRTLHGGTPITIVCHSQGNMVGMAAAFIGAARNPDWVADTYVLVSPPYSIESSLMYDYTNGGFLSRPDAARKQTLRALVARVAQRGARTRCVQTIDAINDEYRFVRDGETRYALGTEQDLERRIDRDNCGKVFLYCNPHDQVIGASPIQGIGWRGLSREELADIDDSGRHFFLRVWAEGVKVGCPTVTKYHYWDDHWLTRRDGKPPQEWWFPPSPRARYRATYEARGQWLMKALGVLGIPLAWVAAEGGEIRINATPKKDHCVPVNAPPLPEPLEPASLRAAGEEAGGRHGAFDEWKDDVQAVRQGGDGDARRAQRYEDRASERLLRAQGKRDGLAEQSPQWAEAVTQRYAQMLDAPPDNATDHGTILGHAEHCRLALAYDVAVGVCRITAPELHELRKYADWRYVGDSKGSEGWEDLETVEREAVEDALYYAEGGWSAGSEKQNVTAKYPESERAKLAPDIADRPQRELVYSLADEYGR